MAERNQQGRYSRRDRYDAGDDDYRQQEQFSEGWRDHDDYGQSSRQMGESAYGRSDYRQSEPSYDTDWDRQERYSSDGGFRRGNRAANHRGHYGPARFDGPDRGFASFTSEDQGGRDFVARGSRDGYSWQGARVGLTPEGYGFRGETAGSGYAGRGERYRDDERGFFERAGDEIASWFGDDEAARRREMDHRGRGPQNYTRSDERILEDACDQLTEDWAVDARNVQVTVDKGEVTLDGTVGTREEKRRAEDCVDRISGVGHVQNNLRVQERPGRNSDRTDRTITAEQPAAKT
jgi:osmotically-inducible protein OsmY